MTAATPTDSVDLDHFRYRVRLYVQVMLVIDLFGWVSDAVTPLFLPTLQAPPLPFGFSVMRFGVTVFLVVLWSLTTFVNRHEETFPVGGFLSPDKSRLVVHADLYDPASGLRHRLLTRVPRDWERR